MNIGNRLALDTLREVVQHQWPLCSRYEAPTGLLPACRLLLETFSFMTANFFLHFCFFMWCVKVLRWECPHNMTLIQKNAMYTIYN